MPKTSISVLLFTLALVFQGWSGVATKYPCYLLSAEPAVDGVLDEKEWGGIPEARGFYILGFDQFALEKQTAFKAGWTRDALFLAVRCEEPRPDKIASKLKDGGNLWEEDGVEFFFVPPSCKTYVQLIVNAKGSRWYQQSAESLPMATNWIVRTKADTNSWSLEMKIPFALLAAAPKDGEQWPVNLARNMLNEPAIERFTCWAPAGNGFNEVSNFGGFIFYNKKIAPDEALKAEGTLECNNYWSRTIQSIAAQAGKYKDGINAALQKDAIKNDAGVLQETWLSLEKTAGKQNMTARELRQAVKEYQHLTAQSDLLMNRIDLEKMADQGVVCVMQVVSPTEDGGILPATLPLPGRQTNEIIITATPGEYEPASFVLHPFKDLKALTIKVSDLAGDGGGKIPAANIDVKVVKCWYQAALNKDKRGGVWGRKVLVPELLLNDDLLVKVDTEKQQNYLKVKSGDTEKYVCVTDPEKVMSNGKEIKWYQSKEIFIKDDSPVLLPVDLSNRSNKQFWLTVKVPDNASAGTYAGTVHLVCEGRTLPALALKVKVLPFKLDSPRTVYDASKKFTSSIYFVGRMTVNSNLANGSVNANLPFLTREQMRAQLTDLYRHGVLNPLVYQGFDKKEYSENKELLAACLKMREEAGLDKQPIYYLGLDLGDYHTVAGALNSRKKEALDALKIQVNDAMSFFRASGISEVYFYGQDEARGNKVSLQRAAWQIVHEAGGKVFVSGYRTGFEGPEFVGNFELVGDIQDLFVCAGNPVKEEVDKWHSVGHRMWNYAYPYGGLECPKVYRQSSGITLWLTGHDGISTWAYRDGSKWTDSETWDAAPKGEPKEYNFAYATMNGVIDTIEWEGYREAMDDIKYASTLKTLIEQNKLAADAAQKAVAREAEDYLGKINEQMDFDRVRADIVGYILKLRCP